MRVDSVSLRVVCHTPGCARDCQQSRTYVPETALRPLSPSCDPSSGVTADKPQPAEVV